MKKLLVLQSLDAAQKKLLEKKLSAFYLISYPDSYDKEHLKEIVKDTDVLFGSFINDEVLQEAKNLKVLQLPGTGADNLNLELLREKSVAVGKVQAHSQFVAEFAVSMMFGLLKKLSLFDRLLRSNSIQGLKKDDDYDFSSHTIFGKTIGIIGYGNIGKKIEEFLKPYGVETIVVTNKTKTKHNVNKNELLRKSDIIFITCPLTSETQDLIRLKDFKQAKKNSLWINISRGPIINLDDLVKALNKNLVGGFGLDNWYPERSDALDLLSEFDSVLLSPYRAIYLNSGNPNIEDAINNLHRYAVEGSLRNTVDYNKGY